MGRGPTLQREDPTLKMTLPAREFATGWLNTAVASGTDRARPQLYRTVLVEVFGDQGVQLVGSDGSMMITCGLESYSDPSGLNIAAADQVPDEAHIAIDDGGRMASLMRWVLHDAKIAEKEGLDPPPISVEVRSGEQASVPTLSPDLDRQIMVVTTEHERLDLDLYDGAYLNWRPYLAAHNPEPTGAITFSTALLARLGKLRDITSGVEFTFSGPFGGARFNVGCEPPVQGVLMPLQVVEAEEGAE